MYLGFKFNGKKSGVWNLHHYLVKAAEHAMPDDPIIHGWRNLNFEDVTYSICEVEHPLFTHEVTIQFSNEKLSNREPVKRLIQLPSLGQYLNFNPEDFDWYVNTGWVFETAPDSAITMLKAKLAELGITGDHLTDVEAMRIASGDDVYVMYSFKSYSFRWELSVKLPPTADGVSSEVSVTLNFTDMSDETI